jgi:hypothetical protein
MAVTSFSLGRVEPQRGEGDGYKYRLIWADCPTKSPLRKTRKLVCDSPQGE